MRLRRKSPDEPDGNGDERAAIEPLAIVNGSTVQLTMTIMKVSHEAGANGVLSLTRVCKVFGPGDTLRDSMVVVASAGSDVTKV